MYIREDYVKLQAVISISPGRAPFEAVKMSWAGDNKYFCSDWSERPGRHLPTL